MQGGFLENWRGKTIPGSQCGLRACRELLRAGNNQEAEECPSESPSSGLGAGALRRTWRGSAGHTPGPELQHQTECLHHCQLPPRGAGFHGDGTHCWDRVVCVQTSNFSNRQKFQVCFQRNIRRRKYNLCFFPGVLARLPFLFGRIQEVLKLL